MTDIAYTAASLAAFTLAARWLRDLNARLEQRRAERDGAAFREQLARLDAEQRAWDRHCETAPGMRLADSPAAERIAARIAENAARDIDDEWRQMAGGAA
jgi:hypothetical protein